MILAFHLETLGFVPATRAFHLETLGFVPATRVFHLEIPGDQMRVRYPIIALPTTPCVISVQGVTVARVALAWVTAPRRRFEPLYLLQVTKHGVWTT